MATKASQLVPSVKDQVTPEEWQVRLELAAAYRLVARFGWDDLLGTHLSVRVPGPEEHFLINPFGLLFEEVTASSLVKVDLHGTIVMASPYPINPAGFTIHSCIHAARLDVGSVMHTHTRAGVAVAAQKDGLLPISQQSMLVMSQVAYHDYEGLALVEAEKARLVHDLGDKRLMILRNHGLLVAAPTIGEAFTSLYMLETACQIQIGATSTGQALIHLDTKLAETVAGQAQFGFSAYAQMAWAALMRKMDRLDPSYRT